VQVLLNDLSNLPPHDGQKLLDVRRDDFAVDVHYVRSAYRVRRAFAAEKRIRQEEAAMRQRPTPRSTRWCTTIPAKLRGKQRLNGSREG
jgi:hypothetical protein